MAYDVLWFYEKGAKLAVPPADGSPQVAADIWDNEDEFHYAFKETAGGATSMIVKVETLENTQPFGKAGVMIRDSLGPGSRNTGLFITPENGVRFQYRLADKGTTDRQFTEGITDTLARWQAIRTSSSSSSAMHMKPFLVTPVSILTYEADAKLPVRSRRPVSLSDAEICEFVAKNEKKAATPASTFMCRQTSCKVENSGDLLTILLWDAAYRAREQDVWHSSGDRRCGIVRESSV